jgi:thiol-disulfide isomerase/thioredoxin
LSQDEGLFDKETVEALREIFTGFPRKLVDILVVEESTDPGDPDPIDPPGEEAPQHDNQGKTQPPPDSELTEVHLEHREVKGCPTCGEAKMLAEELTKVAGGKLEFRIIDKNSPEAEKLIPRYVPAFIYDTPKRNIRYYGLPSGQEFAPFIYVHKYIATGELNIPKEVAEEAKKIDVPLHVKIFVTPECPYCPLVVDAFNQFALVNDNLLVETIEAVELPKEADIYGVAYVPDIVFNDPDRQREYGVEPVERINGYMPPDQMIKMVIHAAEKLKRIKTEKK